VQTTIIDADQESACRGHGVGRPRQPLVGGRRDEQAGGTVGAVLEGECLTQRATRRGQDLRAVGGRVETQHLVTG
jgi:hypothetical protein